MEALGALDLHDIPGLLSRTAVRKERSADYRSAGVRSTDQLERACQGVRVCGTSRLSFASSMIKMSAYALNVNGPIRRELVGTWTRRRPGFLGIQLSLDKARAWSNLGARLGGGGHAGGAAPPGATPRGAWQEDHGGEFRVGNTKSRTGPLIDKPWDRSAAERRRNSALAGIIQGHHPDIV